ncbi:TPA: hypothetical protein HA351_10080 [Methanosarcinaceae archaeon]|nr:hypothetical protein [Methanosarcinaceae archaeon]
MEQDEQYTFDEKNKDTIIVTYKGEPKKLGSKDTIIVTYKGEPKKLGRLETVAIESIKYLGCWISGLLYLFLGLIFFIIGYHSKSNFLQCLSLLGMFFFILALEVSNSVSYFKSRKCKNCGREFAYDEIGEPEITEISTLEDYSVKVYRCYKCRYCGYDDVVESPHEYWTKKGEMMDISAANKLDPYLTHVFGEPLLRSLSFRFSILFVVSLLFSSTECFSWIIVINIILLFLAVLFHLAAYSSRTFRCRNCGKSFAYKEFRRSDIKENFSIGKRITTVYYRCKYCSHEYIRKLEYGIFEVNDENQ